MSLFHEVMYYSSLSEKADLQSEVDRLKNENSRLKNENTRLRTEKERLEKELLLLVNKIRSQDTEDK